MTILRKIQNYKNGSKNLNGMMKFKKQIKRFLETNNLEKTR